MEYKELAKLDCKTRDAYTELVALNKEYNDLLISLRNGSKQAIEPVVSEEEKKIIKRRNILRIGYWVVILGDILVYSFLGIPRGIYLTILISDIVIYQVGSIVFALKVTKVRENSGNVQPSANNNKDELFEKLCKARELYHSLRTQRDEAFIGVDDEDYQKYLEHVDQAIELSENADTVENNQETTKTLSLEIKD